MDALSAKTSPPDGRKQHLDQCEVAFGDRLQPAQQRGTHL
jgi:hypothetical protein